MKLRFWQISIILLVTAAFIAAPSGAMAALGGDVASIQADQAHMKAALQIQTGRTYTVHELRQTGGMVVREFIAPSGRVFAVAWHGPAIPELRQLLGTYFDQFSQAAQTHVRRPGHAPLTLRQNGLVFQSGGHMRSFTGRAYLDDQLPQGVTADVIR